MWKISSIIKFSKGAFVSCVKIQHCIEKITVIESGLGLFFLFCWQPLKEICVYYMFLKKIELFIQWDFNDFCDIDYSKNHWNVAYLIIVLY